MCGIIGSVGTGLSEKQFLNARDAMTHRGPDDAGFFVDRDAGVMLGHRRLSIIDLSEAGHQPMASNDGRYMVVFNGEVYNYIELREELRNTYDFRTASDTEVILAAYSKWGLDCAKHFIGMFAIAIYDRVERALVLFRDRLGIKPIYYQLGNDGFFFASEIKSLFMMGVDRTPNTNALKDYLVSGYYDHTEQTFFKNVYHFPAGYCGVFKDGQLSKHAYWSGLEEALKRAENRGWCIDEYWSVFENAVAIRMRADVPYAVMLSGGLDSSVLAVTAEKYVTSKPLNVMTFRHDDQRYDEGPWADLVSKGRGWISANVTITEEKVVAMMDQAMWHQEEPFGGVATMADMMLAEAARRAGIFMLLEGQGADETLGGYEYYYAYHLADLASVDEVAARALHIKYASLRGISSAGLDESFNAMVRKGRSSDIVLGQDGSCVSGEKGLSGDIINLPGTDFEEMKVLSSRFEDAMFRDLFHTKVPRVLRFKDKSSMMFGVELRVPFLDHRLVELSFGIPPQEKLKDGYTKYLMRSKFGKSLPEQTVFHVKRQIQTPQREWLRAGLSSYVQDTINSKAFASRGIFDACRVRKLFDEYIRLPEKYPNGFFVWQWVMIERWFEKFIDGFNPE